MLFLWGKEASLFLKDWNEKGMDGGKNGAWERWEEGKA